MRDFQDKSLMSFIVGRLFSRLLIEKYKNDTLILESSQSSFGGEKVSFWVPLMMFTFLIEFSYDCDVFSRKYSSKWISNYQHYFACASRWLFHYWFCPHQTSITNSMIIIMKHHYAIDTRIFMIFYNLRMIALATVDIIFWRERPISNKFWNRAIECQRVDEVKNMRIAFVTVCCWWAGVNVATCIKINQNIQHRPIST